MPFRVLILEGANARDSLLADLLHTEFPDGDIVQTAGPAAARALAETHSFELFVIDSALSAGTQIDLVERFLEHSPGAHIIIAAGDSVLAGNRLPNVHVLAQPVNPIEMLELIHTCRKRVAPAPAPVVVAVEPNVVSDEHHFVVVLNRHTPIEVVQFKCLSGATTALDFVRTSGPGGCVWFDRGEICHAETGSLKGKAAFVEIMSWGGGSIVEVFAPPPVERTIEMPWQSLLMCAAHAADERRAETLSA